MRAGQELADRYRLMERLGRGGMGEVWRAYDRVLDRDVAIKIVLAGWRPGDDSTRAMARFRREISATTKLDHPAITTVLDSGAHDGHPFLVLELIAGDDLTAVLARHADGMPVEEVLAIGQQIAEGLAAAHAAGIVHRDVKPANVMVVRIGNARWMAHPGGVIEPVTEPPGWRVKICDFGIAWLDGATAGLSTARARLGTPAYTSPEQIENQPVDGRADLYALGCTLFELLTGRPPFPTGDALALIAMHLVADPPSVRSLRAEVPEHLDRFLLTLLAKAPDERPDDAASVARTLRALLRGERITPTLLGTLPGHTGKVTALAVSPDGVVLVTAAADGTLRLWDTRHGFPRGTRHSGVSVDAVAFTPDGGLLAGGSHEHAVYVWDQFTGRVSTSMRGHTARVGCMAFAPDGSVVASGSRDRTVRVWDPVTRRDLATLTGHTDFVEVVAFDPAGTRLASADADAVVRVWDLTTGSTVATLAGHDTRIGALAFSPDGEFLAGGGWAPTVWLWNVATGEHVALAGHTDDIEALAFSPDGALLASGGRDHSVRLWDPPTGRLLRTLTGPTAPVTRLAFSPDGRILAAGDEDGTTRVWVIDVAPGALVLPWSAVSRSAARKPDVQIALEQQILDSVRERGPDHPDTLDARSRLAHWTGVDGNDPASALAMYEDLLADHVRVKGREHADTLIARHRVAYWRLKSGRAPSHSAVAIYTDLLADFLAFMEPDDVATLRVRRDLTYARLKEGDAAHAVADYPDLLADYTRVLGPGHAETLSVQGYPAYAVGKSGEATRVLIFLDELLPDYEGMLDTRHPGSLKVMGALEYWLTRSRRKASLPSPAEKAYVAPRSTGAARTSTADHGRLITTLAFRPDGGVLVSAGVDVSIRWWDPATGRPLGVIKDYEPGYFHEVSFSPDGALLASGNWYGGVWLWDLSRGQATAVMTAPSLAQRLHLGRRRTLNHIRSVSFSPDGKLLAGGGEDGIRGWNPGTGRLVTEFTDPRRNGPIDSHSVVFSPDGALLAGGGIRSDITLWNPATGEAVGELEGHTSAVNAVAFSPDGALLASCGRDDSVRLWDPHAMASVGTFRGHTSRVNAIAFSPDGALLASAGDDGTVRLWDPATGGTVAVLADHTGKVRAAAFSPDGSLLASGGEDQTVRIRQVADLV